MGVKILFFSRGTLGQNSMFPEKGGQNSIFFPSALKKGGQNRGAYQPTSLKGCPPRGHYIPELLSKTPECITEKLDTHSFSGFSNYMKNYYIRNYNENCLIENCYICQK